jgi:hypothetical protein
VCRTVEGDLLAPLLERCGRNLEVKRVDVTTTAGYESFLATEAALLGESGRWEIPVVVAEDTYLIGEQAIRQELIPHLECVYGAGGNSWPAVSELDAITAPTPASNPFGGTGEGVATCLEDEASAVCETGTPIFVLYLSSSDCSDTCDRTRYDLRYLQGVYPQMTFDERDIGENAELADALAVELDAPDEARGVAPAVVVGSDYLSGSALTLDALRSTLESYAESGAPAVWYTLDLP